MKSGWDDEWLGSRRGERRKIGMKEGWDEFRQCNIG